MPVAPSPARPPDAQRAQFIALLAKSIDGDALVKLVLAKYRGPEPELLRVIARRLTVRGEPCLSFTYRYKTKDVTKNIPVAEAIVAVGEELGTSFENAHLLTATQDIQLAVSRKGKTSLRVGRAEIVAASAEEHDREKQRFLDLERPFLSALGITDASHRLIPAMARKWKQINHFIDVFSAALKSSALANSPAVQVADFGSGKGYLTFAIHDWLRGQGKEAQVTGVELRADMVKLCSDAATRSNLQGLRFKHGDMRSYTPAHLDVMIALHACDTATDFAIHLGLRAGAEIIMCSPCCHKQLRPQMASPAVLRPLLQHGIHLGQEAEMVTDGLRALLLEAEGYATQVFEFVSLEHTSKNKMILAVKRSQALSAARHSELLEQIAGIKQFYGVREQALETLLSGG